MAKKSTRGRRKKQPIKFVIWFKGLGKQQQVLLCMGVATVCLLVFAIIFVASKFAKMQREDIKEHEIIINETDEEIGVGYTNIALFGIDARNGIDEKGTRTDTIIIASLNNETKEVRLVSVYRDTLLDLSNGKIQKCNAAYSTGGVQRAINMLNMNLDLNIKDYVTVDWSAVADTVDLMGGLEIDVKKEEIPGINEHMISTSQATGKPMKKVTKAGLQTLNGVQVTTYCRIRSTAGSDYARTERQRLVIQKMVEKAIKSDLKTINNMIDEIFPKIKTSLSMTEILSYAKYFAKYKIGETAGFPFEKGNGNISGKGSCVFPITLKSNVQELHKFLFGEEDYEPSSKVKDISEEIAYIVGKRKPVTNDTPSGGGETTPGDGTSTGTGTGTGDGTGTGTGDGTGTGTGDGTETGEGDDKTPGEGDNKIPGEDDDKTPGEGDDKIPGEGDDKTPGESDDKTPGEGDDKTPGEGDDNTPDEGGETNPSEGTGPTPGGNNSTTPSGGTGGTGAGTNVTP